MGNNESMGSAKLGSLQVVREIEHPLIGGMTQVVDTARQSRHLLKVFTCADPNQHREELTKLKMRKLKNNKYLLALSHYEEKEIHELCASTFRIFALFQDFETDLQTIFVQRQQQRRLFAEQQLMAILSTCVDALIYVQDNGLKHTFLTKKAIVLVNGQYKILDSCLVRRHHPYYSLLMGQKIEEDVFLAPQILEQLRIRSHDACLPPKSDVYSLGVMLLHLASLESLASYFDYQILDTDSQSLMFKISRIGYSDKLKDLLKGMVEEKEEERFGLITLQETIGLASGRETLRGNRSSSLYELFKMRHNKSTSKENKARPNKTIMLKKITLRAKENKSPAKSPSVLQPLQDTTNTAEPNKLQSSFNKSKCTSSLNGDSCMPILQLADFRLDPPPLHPHQLNLKFSRRYRTTESYNNSPIDLARQGESDLRSNDSQGERKFGRMFNEDGGYYEGEIVEGRPEGNGVRYFPDGRVEYSGSWLGGRFHGFGTLYNVKPEGLSGALDYSDLNSVRGCWLKYQGEFFENEKEGFGTTYLTNHEKFSGCFKKNRVDGYGTFYKRDGTFVNGIWSQDQLLH